MNLHTHYSSVSVQLKSVLKHHVHFHLIAPMTARAHGEVCFLSEVMTRESNYCPIILVVGEQNKRGSHKGKMLP